MTRPRAIVVCVCLAVLFGLSFRQSLTGIPSESNPHGGAILHSATTWAAAQQARQSSVVDVRSYGAKGDGVADDMPAIQAAIEVANAAGGGTVFIPRGTYLLTSGLTLYSDVDLTGTGQDSILQAKADNVTFVTCTGLSNVRISGLLLDGGGQAGDVYTGYRAARGIKFDGCSHFCVDDVRIRNCGVVKAGNPTSDAGYGGFGILIYAIAGATYDGLLSHCYVECIAGGGMNVGDGIYISGGNADPNITTRSIMVRDCYVATVGRHGYAIARDGSTSIASDIQLVGCTAVATALSGIDFEPGDDCLVYACSLTSCGNDRTYYHPAKQYGATYRLLAGMACGNEDRNITVQGCRFSRCYYGINYGSVDGLTICETRLDSSFLSDLRQGLASAPNRLRVTDVVSASSGDNFLLHTTTRDDSLFTNVDFTGSVQVSQSRGSTFQRCTFRKGFQFTGSGSERIAWDNCLFLDWAGPGIGFSDISHATLDCIVNNCRFIGSGNMIHGISFQYDDAYRWTVTNSEFDNLKAGIYHSNANAKQVFLIVCGNNFRSCVEGISLTQAICDGIIADNTFESITDYCIDIRGIIAGKDMVRVSILGNVATASVRNGLRVVVTTGTWDHCVIVQNDMRRVEGKGYSLDAGNANGTTGT